MKKTLLSTFVVAELLTVLYAGGDIEPVEVSSLKIAQTELGALSLESNFYVVAKAMYMLGDTVNHEESVLDGNKDFGFGVDIGYRFGNGFALEYDFSYGKNTVTEKSEDATEDVKAKYYTSALDLVYGYEMTERVGVFAKVGYEYEWEKIDALDIDGTDHGMVFGAGFEVALDEDYTFVAEYEHSTIAESHGDSVFAGLMFNF